MTNAITIHQPHATLIALGVKTIETRSWPAPKSAIGQQLVIHAGSARGERFSLPYIGEWCYDGLAQSLWTAADLDTVHTVPLGAVVASCTLTACVPIVDLLADPPSDHLCIGKDGRLRLWAFTSETPRRWSAYDPAKRASAGGPNVDDITGQQPYGDFRSGRWAWLLDDIKPCEPIPAKGNQRLWKWEA